MVAAIIFVVLGSAILICRLEAFENYGDQLREELRAERETEQQRGETEIIPQSRTV